MSASKIKIRVDNSDGTFTEYVNVLPFGVAQYLLIEAMEWKTKWVTTSEVFEKFQEDSKKLNPEGH